MVAYRRAREASLVLYPHVNLTLTGLLRRGLKLAVLSDAPRPEAWNRLCYLQLQHVFDTVITFEDTGFRKPHTVPFRKVLAAIGCEPHETAMLGDWPERDLVGARKVGMVTVGNEGGDYVIDDIRQLLGIVDDLNGKGTDS